MAVSFYEEKGHKYCKIDDVVFGKLSSLHPDGKVIVTNFIFSDPIFALENAIIFAFTFGLFIVSFRTSVACFASSLFEDVRGLLISSPSFVFLYLDEPLPAESDIVLSNLMPDV